MQKRLISFKKLPPPHSGVVISDQLILVIMEWKALDKVAFITVDNASLNDVAVAQVSSILKDKSKYPPDMQGKFFHVRCAAHVINLIVKDGLKTLATSISKICETVRHFKSTPAQRKQFADAIQQSNVTKKAWPSTDVPTCWNSTYLMLKSALPYREVFSKISDNNANYLNCPSPKEWKKIVMMKDFLEIFNTATLKLGMTPHPTAHMTYMNMTKINKQLKDSIESGPPYIADIIEPMQEKYNKYWKIMEHFAAITVVFDPRYKLSLLEFLLADKFGSNKEAIATRLKKIKDDICTWYDEVASWQASNKPANASPTSTEPNSNSKYLESNPEARFKAYLAGKKTKTSWGTAEIDLYLEELTVPIDSPSFEILKWWSINSLQLPTLAILAKTILMTPMMSIASESAFSTGGRVLSDSRNRLKPATLEALICGQDWIFTNEGLNKSQAVTGDVAEYDLSGSD
ncbi:hypothetical protein PCASD_21479 [Puccinia coronata f. sp. avenae]|uniref:HAT C-terminal dimerisation domain-containing protein n=1 Tax=Puccinia coronata f. sp. avenae TaxID=200324 RepID=A0A2N5S9M8_9BASI|nr:hypothetical protein PCASD_21479 [Puccinia coronata f. sp. avenae]